MSRFLSLQSIEKLTWEPFPRHAGFKPLFMLHNFLLSTGSALLLALMLEEVRFWIAHLWRTLLTLYRAQIVPIIWKHGLFYAICADEAWTPRLETYYIFNYYVRVS